MSANTGESLHRVHATYEQTPQAAGLTLTVEQCGEIWAMGIPWPISGDLSRTQPVRHQTLQLRYGKGDQDEEAEDLTPAPPELEAGTAERKAAKSLSVGLGTLLAACAALWDRTLTAERDARAGTEGTKQARGYVTRELLDELRAHLSLSPEAEAAA
ncbi:hypothetical protein D7Z96_08715 [Pseudarthrobacter phenanthrenivorans]|uniref:Uncharacterized protein n=1 Tax=Pseudarthrobacter phenanthrenivorans TaxID=361575 RepID=A0A3B0FS31_PSEPS|nr:hypothetical protein [Pseudarthrobacter phenanthrenivorans]RKO24502.1 hypothetical protein D7Z96_08715 [Pseudarthrobacter phenanthrenivorans]